MLWALATTLILAGPATPTVAQFAKIEPGKTPVESVSKILGPPARSYPFIVEPGRTPVHVPYTEPRNLISGVANPWETAADSAAPPADEGEAVEVMEYLGPGRQSYYVVLRDDVVYYAVGPVPEDESTPEAVHEKLGPATVFVESATYSGDVSRQLEIHAYPARRTAYLMKPGADTFVAKAVGVRYGVTDDAPKKDDAKKKPKKSKK